MPMPTDIGVIDLMLGLPEGHKKDWYQFLAPQLHDESSDYEFPVQYMFKDVPKDIDDDCRPSRHRPQRDGSLRHRAGDDRHRRLAPTATAR